MTSKKIHPVLESYQHVMQNVAYRILDFDAPVSHKEIALAEIIKKATEAHDKLTKRGSKFQKTNEQK